MELKVSTLEVDLIAGNKGVFLPSTADYIPTSDLGDDDVDEQHAVIGDSLLPVTLPVPMGLDPPVPSYCSSLNHVLSLKEDRLPHCDNYLQYIKSKYKVLEEHQQARGDSYYQSWKDDYDRNNSDLTAITTASIAMDAVDDECEIVDITLPLPHAQSSLRGHYLPMQVQYEITSRGAL